jgi:phosphoglycolate phosphatase-like HAD superfamily hydrolase
MSDSSSPARPFLIGIDSDGTVFDSMEIKHKRVFQPLAVELWGLQAFEKDYNRIAEGINLYSVHRGLNRFQSLIMAFERLIRESPDAQKPLEGHGDLRKFVISSEQLSGAALQAYNANEPSPFLDRALEWSRRCDELYAKIMKEEGNPPYPSVRETLEQASRQAEIMVISSSSHETLIQDWGETGLLPLTTHVAGQEMGNKTRQLESALRGGADPAHTLMMGDAPGDLEAARANDVLFYPILPGAEEASWQRFKSEAMDRFFEGTYAGEYEESLLADFENVLRPDDPWPENEDASA